MLNTVLWLKGNRGIACLKRLLDAGYGLDLLVMQAQPGKDWYETAKQIAAQHTLEVFEPDDPNGPDSEAFLAARAADLFVLAGYGKILKPNIIALPRSMCINLHGGKLPEQRGSSPMNWSLIRGQSTFGISIIKVDAGVDTGELIAEREFPIRENDTIRDLHAQADVAFPEMLVEVIDSIQDGTCRPWKQDLSRAAYFPVRFPEDGLVLWDTATARQIHDRIRALTEPYPCAFTYFKGRRIKLIASRLRRSPFYGEPGRVYLIRDEELLVCAQDQCLWIREAILEDTGEPLHQVINRYDRLATVQGAAGLYYESLGGR